MLFQLMIFAQSANANLAGKKRITLEQVVIWVAGIAILVAIGFYVISFLRGAALGQRAESSTYLDEFRRLRDEGAIDDEEFSQVKSSLVVAPKTDLEKIDFCEDEPDDSNNEGNRD